MLPKIDVPTFDAEIPSIKKRITMRPFLVKEEKILLMAASSQDIDTIAAATKQVLRNCILDADVNVEKLALFDLEYLFVQLRIHSVGETLELKFEALKNSTCEQCKKTRTVSVDLKLAKIEFPEEYNNKIQLTDNISIVLNWPQAKMLGELEKARSSNDVNSSLKLLWSCVETIFEGETAHAANTTKESEGVEFLECLPPAQFEKIEKFFLTAPRLKQTVHINCKDCGFHQEYSLVGLEDFFA